MQKGWLDILLKAFSHKEVDAVVPGIGPHDPALAAGYGQTWDEKLEIRWLKRPSDLEPVPLAPGACLAIKKDVFKCVGGFDRGFNSWGYEDVELSLKLWLFGYKIFVTPYLRIGHCFRKTPPYAVNGIEFVYNKSRMAVSHFKEARIDKVISLLKGKIDLFVLFTKLILSDSVEQRKEYFARRKHDDNWFFDKEGDGLLSTQILMMISIIVSLIAVMGIIYLARIVFDLQNKQSEKMNAGTAQEFGVQAQKGRSNLESSINVDKVKNSSKNDGSSAGMAYYSEVNILRMNKADGVQMQSVPVNPAKMSFKNPGRFYELDLVIEKVPVDKNVFVKK